MRTVLQGTSALQTSKIKKGHSIVRCQRTDLFRIDVPNATYFGGNIADIGGFIPFPAKWMRGKKRAIGLYKQPVCGNGADKVAKGLSAFVGDRARNGDIEPHIQACPGHRPVSGKAVNDSSAW